MIRKKIVKNACIFCKKYSICTIVTFTPIIGGSMNARDAKKPRLGEIQEKKFNQPLSHLNQPAKKVRSNEDDKDDESVFIRSTN